MVISEVVTLFFYVISIAFLPEYFGMYCDRRDMAEMSHSTCLSVARSFICIIVEIRMESCIDCMR